MTKQQLIAEVKKEYEEKFVNFDGTIDEDAEDVWEWLEEQLEVLAESVRREAKREGVEEFLEFVDSERPHSWACEDDNCVCEGGMFMGDLRKIFLLAYLSQQESSSEKGDHD